MRASKQKVSGAGNIDYDRLAGELMDVSSLLRDLGMVIVYNKMPINAETAGLKDEKTIDSLSPDLDKEFDDMYKVYTDGFAGDSEISSDVRVERIGKDSVKVYFPWRTNLPFVVVRLDSVTYTYPPQDMGSMLFFQLNPHVERELLSVLGQYTVPAEVEFKVSSYVEAKQKLSSMLSDKHEVELDTLEIYDYYNIGEVYGSVALRGGHVFRHIEAFYSNFGFSSDFKGEDAYHVALNYRGKNVVYTLTHGHMHQALSIILEKLVPEEDLRALERVLKKVKKEVTKSYLLLQVVKKIEEI